MSLPLSDKLKALGVQLGGGGLKPAPPPAPIAAPETRRGYPIEEVVAGMELSTPAGAAFCVEAVYPPQYRHGRAAAGLDDGGLAPQAPLHSLARWAGLSGGEYIEPPPLPGLCFLDTETSGLSGGTGTLAFMVGAGRYEPAEGGGWQFRLRQFFLRYPGEEAALLLALESFLSPCQALVSFNGKSFDVPLLHTRYRLQGWPLPMQGVQHFDLLHLARRLWRARLPSRSLGSLEDEILQVRRGQDEVPGWLIPQLYFEYLHSGDSRPLAGVFYHNAMDILSLARLLAYLAPLLHQPQQAPAAPQDRAALARLAEELGENESALGLYRQALAENPPPETAGETRARLARLLKRLGRLDEAAELWQQAAENEVEACLELAKLYEHQRRQPQTALRWCEQALALNARLGPAARLLAAELNHRRQRLLSKCGGG